MSRYYSIQYNKKEGTFNWLCKPSNRNFIFIENKNYYIFIEGEVFNYDLKSTHNQKKLYSDFINNSNPLEGDYCLYMFNKVEKKLVFTNDIKSSKKVFVRYTSNYVYFSNSIFQLIPIDWKINKTGLAQLLANGFTFNGNTLIKGIDLIQYANLITISFNSITKTKYWTFDIQNGQLECSKSKFIEFDKLFSDSIKKRVKKNNLISLSGGYESTSIALKLKKELGLIDSFSYYGQLSDMFDKKTVKSQEKYLKTTVEYLKIRPESESYFTLNALLGMGVSNICRELSIIYDLKKKFSDYNIFFGEEPFGTSKKSKNHLDNLRIIGESDLLNSYKKYFDNSFLNQLSKSLNEEFKSFEKKVTNKDYAAIDELYYSIHTCNKFTNWRYFFWEQNSLISIPLLDDNIIKFFAKYKSSKLGHKSFFIKYNQLINKAFYKKISRAKSKATLEKIDSFFSLIFIQINFKKLKNIKLPNKSGLVCNEIINLCLFLFNKIIKSKSKAYIPEKVKSDRVTLYNIFIQICEQISHIENHEEKTIYIDKLITNNLKSENEIA